jgi:hypothetical protein
MIATTMPPSGGIVVSALDVFHSLCGWLSNKAVDKPISWLCRQALGTR